jgi:NCAIR mutase (PurE)-related protein
MEQERIRELLERVSRGEVSTDEALRQLQMAPIDRLGFANVDLHRALRCGFPEVIYGPGKTTDEIVEIAGRLIDAGQSVLVTRVDREVREAMIRIAPDAEYHERARMVTVRMTKPDDARPGVTVVSAGTSDRAVAEEAIVTSEMMGNVVRSIFDVGIAGVHRLLEHREPLLDSRVIVVVAGMEGALPSLVAGLVACPVIGVPTSTGYGAGAGGQAALLAMLNSCASGLTVVNIDNGFGAGYAASLVNRRAEMPQKRRA